VLVSHFALSEASRNVAVVRLWEWLQTTSRDGPQLFVGDLNANPDTPAMQFLNNGNATLHGVTPHGIYDAW
jgi:endonuclease/exonuclease/phosphatase family metal-dependent hydrolase